MAISRLMTVLASWGFIIVHQQASDYGPHGGNENLLPVAAGQTCPLHPHSK